MCLCCTWVSGVVGPAGFGAGSTYTVHGRGGAFGSRGGRAAAGAGWAIGAGGAWTGGADATGAGAGGTAAITGATGEASLILFSSRPSKSSPARFKFPSDARDSMPGAGDTTASSLGSMSIASVTGGTGETPFGCCTGSGAAAGALCSGGGVGIGAGGSSVVMTVGVDTAGGIAPDGSTGGASSVG